MKTYNEHLYKADNGKKFVLTAKGKSEVASYRHYEVGDTIEFGSSDKKYGYIHDVDNGYIEEVDDPDYVVAPGYRAIYDYKGYQLPAGNPYVFFSAEMAQRMADHFNKRPWRKADDPKAYVIPATYEGNRPRELRMYEGKPVYNDDWWFGDIGEVGDLVEWEIVDWMGNCVPPASYGNNFIQCGEPYSSRFDDNTGKYRSTYSTFKRIAEDVWMYCGNCFRGEDVERGAEPVYVAG